jgi:uncharacterized delta-60 repeat protein
LQSLTDEDLTQAVAVQPDGSIVIAGESFPLVGSLQYYVARFTPNGAQDLSFSATGIRVFDFGSYLLSPELSLAIQPDGRIVFGAQCRFTGGSYFCAAKFNANGTFAATFSNGGIGRSVITTSPFVFNRFTAMRVQPDGKLLLSGSCDNAICIARVLDDGSIDTNFGIGGITSVEIVTGPDSENLSGDIAVDRSGKIVASGRCREPSTTVPQPGSQLCMARFDGGISSARSCNLDIDGDGQVFSTTDALIMSRAAAKVAGSAIIGGITFPANATRNTWPLVRDYLVRQCGMSIAL